MFPPNMGNTLAACLVVTGILVYFGIHVVSRKVIFVDLAMAQIAALGTVIGIVMGYDADHDPTALYLYSLALTAVGAMLLALTRTRVETVPHEAIIGILYSVAFAATLLLLSKSHLGPAEVERILKGDILYVSGERVAITALVYAGVGVLHFLLRKPFFRLSFQEGGHTAGTADMGWDFLFYLSFGFVAASAVSIVGVFLVFAYLVIPAAGAMLFTRHLPGRLAIGWIGAGTVSIAGVWISHAADLPTSPLIVVLLAGALLAAAVTGALLQSDRRGRTALRLGAGAVGLGAVIGALFLFRAKREDPFEHLLRQIEARTPGERITALQGVSTFPGRRKEWEAAAAKLLDDPDKQVRIKAIGVLAAGAGPEIARKIAERLKDPEPEVRGKAAKALRGLHAPGIDRALIEAARSEEEPDIRLEILGSALEHGLPEAVDLLFDLATDPEEFEPLRREAFELLTTHLDIDLRSGVHGSIEKWWDAHAEEVRNLVRRMDEPKIGAQERRKAFERLRALTEEGLEFGRVGAAHDWWKDNRDRIRWNPGTRRFERRGPG